MKYYIGCCGWKNNLSLKDFYHSNLESKYFLSYYSKIFNFVYMDLILSPIPTRYTTIQRWSEETPGDFRFSIQIPQYILENRYKGKVQRFSEFLKLLTPLQNKILCIVLSPPKSISLKEGGLNWIENILNECN